MKYLIKVDDAYYTGDLDGDMLSDYQSNALRISDDLRALIGDRIGEIIPHARWVKLRVRIADADASPF
jgi:hypothetical protein